MQEKICCVSQSGFYVQYSLWGYCYVLWIKVSYVASGYTSWCKKSQSVSINVYQNKHIYFIQSNKSSSIILCTIQNKLGYVVQLLSKTNTIQFLTIQAETKVGKQGIYILEFMVSGDNFFNLLSEKTKLQNKRGAAVENKNKSLKGMKENDQESMLHLIHILK